MGLKLQASNKKYLNAQQLTIKLKQCFIACSLLLLSLNASAEAPTNTSIWSDIQDSLAQTWHSTDYELYVPVNTWHNRSFYSAEKIDSFNEQPWGLGVGKYRYDEDGDWHGLFVMAFLDSHDRVEPIMGYGFQKIWHSSENTRLGLGYTVAATARKDLGYMPLPIVLPLLSLQYKTLAVQTTYVPGGNGNGNVLFTWLRWEM